jgi:signal transduction histidine kinase
MGLFTMAKTDEVFPDIQSAFPQEERALARGIAKLAAQLIERVQDHANTVVLQEIQRQYHDFLALASHELRNPLATIKGNAQLLLRRIDALARHEAQRPSSEEDFQHVQDRLQYVVQNANKLERIIGELMDVSRIQSGQLVMAMQPGDLGAIVRLAVEDSRHVAGDHVFLLFFPQEAIPILADADRIAQVVQNYLSNAIKYSPVACPIEVRVQREGAQVRVLVRDEGPGLALEEQTRVWERFYRVPGVSVFETSHAEANLGLGLHVCKEIIESHHGQVGVDSIPGQGSTFWFLLDLLPPFALPEAT